MNANHRHGSVANTPFLLAAIRATAEQNTREAAPGSRETSNMPLRGAL
jgi:hypothetical protein